MNCQDVDVAMNGQEVPTKKIRPLGDRVLVRVIKPEDKAVNGVFRPDIAQERPEEGIVVRVGRGRLQADGTRIPVDVIEGEKVYFGKYTGNEVEMNGEKLLLIQESELQAGEED